MAESEESNESVNDQQKDQESFISYQFIQAASTGNIDFIKSHPISNKVVKDYDSRTPLHLASVEGHFEIVRFLVEEWDVDVLAKDRWGNTAYDDAVSKRHHAIADFLRNRMGTYRQDLDIEQYSIISAASKGDLSYLKQCHKKGTDMFFSDYDKRTPLHLAAAEGHEDVVEFLIKECEVEADVKDRWNHTPYDEAVSFNHVNVAERILKLNADQVTERSKDITKEGITMYKEEVKSEKTNRHSVRLNIVGHVAAGKTTLANMILEKDIEDPQHTNSIDIHVYEAVSTEEGEWKVLKTQSDFKDYNDETLAHNRSATQTRNEIKIYDRRDTKPYQGRDTKPYQGRVLAKRHVTDINNYIAKKKGKLSPFPPTFINIWDFGGHGIFHATHQMFHSTESMYLLVVDLSKSLDDKLDTKQYPEDLLENLNLKTIEDLCKYWINTIYANVSSKKGTPPIFLVGTHTDTQMFTSMKIEPETVFNRIKELFDGDIRSLIQDECFLITNKPRAMDGVRKIKEAIFEYMISNKEFDIEIPKRWIPLENSIRMNRHLKCVEFKEIMKLDGDSLEPIGDEEKVKDFLCHQHRQGSVIYFRQPQLSNYVILDPQWLIDAYKTIITIPTYFKGKAKDRDEMVHNARIRKGAFKKIWEKETDKTFASNQRVLLEFLTQFGVVATAALMDLDELKMDEDEYFYIPSLLAVKEKEDDSANGDKIFTEIGNCAHKKTIPLQFRMKPGILPPSQYNSILASLMSKWPILVHKETRQLFVNRTVFVLVERSARSPPKKEELKVIHFGVIGMPNKRGNEMEIAVHAVPGKDVKEDEAENFQLCPRKCDQFRRFVETALKESLERFLVDSSSKYELRVRGEVTYFDCSVNINMIIQQWFRDSIETMANSRLNDTISEKELARFTCAIGNNWKILCLALDVPSNTLERISQSTEPVATQIFRGLNEWRRLNRNNATWRELITVLTKCRTVSYDLDVIMTIMEERK